MLLMQSRPARGAWIEMLLSCGIIFVEVIVAPREGRVD